MWLYIFLIILLILEVFIRIFAEKNFFMQTKMKETHFVSHPYLPYAYKRNLHHSKNNFFKYPLDKGRYTNQTNYYFNNIRCCMDKDVDLNKKNKIRILCLGASTTLNSLIYKNKKYTYPELLEEYLNKIYENKFEVINAGIGGYTSTEIFINFAIHLIDTKPDYVILYTGNNDLEASLTIPFLSDYSHSRKNLGLLNDRFKIISKLPFLPWFKTYEYLKSRIFGTIIARGDILSAVRKKWYDLENDFVGLETERRNIENLIILCKANNIEVIMSSFAFYLYDEIKDNSVSNKFKLGIERENKMYSEIADKFQLNFVEIDKLINKSSVNFVDSIHFSHEGMQFIAEKFGEKILEVEKNKI